MLSILVGMYLIFFAMQESSVSTDIPRDRVYYNHPVLYGDKVHEQHVALAPMSTARFRGIVHQQFDYSCGSAALTTLLNGYLGRQFEERQIMEGLLRFGQSEKIVERRGFSMLDMKRLTVALGHPSGGYKASIDDVIKLDHPAIVSIEYAGFKHFVVVKGVKDGHVFVADPALGNISFTLPSFEQAWYQKVMFIVFPNGFKPKADLDIADEDLRVIDDSTLTALAWKEMPSLVRAEWKNADQLSSYLQTVDNVKDSETQGKNVFVPTRMYYRHD